jgi:hypothetical protein
MWRPAVEHVEKTTLGEERSGVIENRLILEEERWWSPQYYLPVLHMRGELPLEIVLKPKARFFFKLGRAANPTQTERGSISYDNRKRISIQWATHLLCHCSWASFAYSWRYEHPKGPSAARIAVPKPGDSVAAPHHPKEHLDSGAEASVGLLRFGCVARV